MIDLLVCEAEALRDKGEYAYLLMKYVDRDLWVRALAELFPGMYIENATDFNYSVCFTMDLNISDIDADVGTERFHDFIVERQCLDRVEVQISAIAPYATYRFVRYTFDGNAVKLTNSYSPFQEDHAFLGDKVREFLATAGLTTLNEAQLSMVVPGVSLEMRESNATVYHCLFDDGY